MVWIQVGYKFHGKIVIVVFFFPFIRKVIINGEKDLLKVHERLITIDKIGPNYMLLHLLRLSIREPESHVFNP